MIRYSAGVIEWRDKELERLDIKTRKILTMAGAFHIRSSALRLYMKRKEGGRGLISTLECMKGEVSGLSEYVRGSEEWMLKVVAAEIPVTESKLDFKRRVEEERRKEFEGRKLHGAFFQDVRDIADDRSWQWLRGGYLSKGFEAYVCAAQEQAIRTRTIRAMIDKENISMVCRKCEKANETLGHLASGCEALAGKEYRRRHDRMGLRVYWEVCKLYGVKCAEKWYEETPDEVRISKDGKVEIWWDRKVVTMRSVECCRPDVTIVNRRTKEWTFVDFSIPWDRNVLVKEQEKINKYAPLCREIAKLHHVRTRVVPIIVGSLGIVSGNLEGHIKELGIPDVLGGLQTSAIVGTSLILKKVLGT